MDISTTQFDGWVEFDAEHWESAPTQPWDLKVSNDLEFITEEDITHVLEQLDTLD
jgi:hypothetical protein